MTTSLGKQKRLALDAYNEDVKQAEVEYAKAMKPVGIAYDKAVAQAWVKYGEALQRVVAACT